MLSRFKKKDSSDEELPELAPTIAGRARAMPQAQSPLTSAPSQAKPALPRLPSADVVSELERTANEMKRFDVSKISESARNERVEIITAKEPALLKSNQILERADSRIEVAAKKEEPIFSTQTYNAGFFSEIIDKLKKEEELITEKKAIQSDILSKHLLTEMKETWDAKKEEVRSKLADKEKQERIVAKIDELSALEAEWQRKELAIEQQRKEVLFVEEMIERKSLELKRLIKEIKFNERSKNPFFLSNGHAIRSIGELLDVLRGMDSEGFSQHVSEMKNDFSSWVESEFKDQKLANRIKDAYSREDLIAILEMI